MVQDDIREEYNQSYPIESLMTQSELQGDK